MIVQRVCVFVWHTSCLDTQEMAFDYLRDNLAENPTEVVLRTNFYFAVIDEADALLIDECKNPMIISNVSVVCTYPVCEAP